MQISIFYSWQSKATKTNKDFIQSSAQLALNRMSIEGKIQPVIDRDTLNIPGSPNIAETIFEKIANCDIFLCDISIINDGDSMRPMPNPNVLIELGYAVAKLGWERVICVMNEAFGGPSKLPFDLQHRRWPIRYRYAEIKTSDESIQAVQDKLSEEIELAIRLVIQSGTIKPRLSNTDKRLLRKVYDMTKSYKNYTLTMFQYFGVQQIGARSSVDENILTKITYGFEYDEFELENDFIAQEIRSFISIFSIGNLHQLTHGNSEDPEDPEETWAERLIYRTQALIERVSEEQSRYPDCNPQLTEHIDKITASGRVFTDYISEIKIRSTDGEENRQYEKIAPFVMALLRFHNWVTFAYRPIVI